jgi:hypothetical protein
MRKAPRTINKTKVSKTDKNPPGPKPTEARRPSEDEIRRRAYEIYVERGGTPGHEFDDWIRAERELQGLPT